MGKLVARATQPWSFLVLGMACMACPAGPKDPPPPEESAEIASAAPRALGALAGGTDAAPPAVFVPRQPGEEPEAMPIPDLGPDAGFEAPDAGVVGNDELPL